MAHPSSEPSPATPPPPAPVTAPAPTRDDSGTAVYDVAIVGGGTAGLSAALWLSRYLHSVVVVDCCFLFSDTIAYVLVSVF